jgi:polysaccharide deacetylase 2 family uncharacterized protein YibQ
MAAPDTMTASPDGRPSAGHRATANALAIAWLLLVAIAAALVAWLFANAEDTRSRRQVSRTQVEVPVDAFGMPRPVATATVPIRAGAEAAEAAIKPADVQLIDRASVGPLPRIGSDGRQPWRVYSRAFAAPDTKPRVSVLFTGLGLRADVTQQAIDKLPSDVSFAFSPYAEKLEDWIGKARGSGHEILLGLGLEPVNFPQHDPGPYTLLTSLTPAENIARLEWVMSRATGYVGLVGEFGSKFSTSVNYLLPPMEQMKRRGLLYVDSRASPDTVASRLARDLGVPRVWNDRFVDREANRAAIDARLLEVERIARLNGQAVAFAQPYPVSIDRVITWLAGLEQKGIAVAPITAIANRQAD